MPGSDVYRTFCGVHFMLSKQIYHIRHPFSSASGRKMRRVRLHNITHSDITQLQFAFFCKNFSEHLSKFVERASKKRFAARVNIRISEKRVDKSAQTAIIQLDNQTPYQEWWRERPCEARQPAEKQGAKSGVETKDEEADTAFCALPFGRAFLFSLENCN